MKLISLLGNSQHLDGGAMFGNAPKILWEKWLPADKNNRIELSCRCMLVQFEKQNILLETGIGAFFEPKLRERYGVLEKEHILLSSLKHLGIDETDIDWVILSHLHFDHAGGLLSTWSDNQQPKLLFPNARYIISKKAWERACFPHERDHASFIPTLNQQLLASNRLEIIDTSASSLGPNFIFHYSNGHTPGMLLTEIQTPKGPILFAADLIPGIAWIHLPITMGYDRFPELVIDEKKHFLNYLAKHNGRLFFTHDPNLAIAEIYINEKQQFAAKNVLKVLYEEF